jgi:hypothetical protein
MLVKDDADDATIDTLAGQFVGLTNKNQDFTHREILMAYMAALGNTVASIACPECRQASASFVKQVLPGLLRQALEAAKHHGGQPPTSDHVH